MSVNTTKTIHDEDSEELTTTKRANIVDLPDVALYTILSYLDITSLGRVCCTCSRLREIASRDTVWIQHSYSPGVSVYHVNKSAYKRKTKRSIPLKERCRIAKNWETKNFQDVQFIKHSTKLMPWIKLHSQKLYVSNAANISCYSVMKEGPVEDKGRHITGQNNDVTRFVVTDEVIVSGFRGGGIIGYDTATNTKKFEYDFNECGDTQAVAAHNDVIIAGFRDGSVKVINTVQDIAAEVNRVTSGNRVPNRIWSVAVAPDGSNFTVGNAGLEIARTPVEVYDMTSCRLLYSLGAECKKGAGVLDIKYETPYTMLTCGYDTSLRLWDLRAKMCVLKWVEPFDAELSSLQSDGNNVIVTGTFQYGMTRLWDKRYTSPIQMYYCGQKRSPVYCLDTDFQRLFVALDFGIHMLDFTTYKSVCKQ